MSTPAERTVRVSQENRLVFVPRGTNTYDRTVRVPQQNRVVFVAKKSTSAERTVYATED